MHESIRKTLDLIEATTRPSKLETVALPYHTDGLEPVMSSKTLDYHFEHLAKGYARRYNAGEGNADFNRAGSYLHNRFFPQFCAPKSRNQPKGAIAELIDSKFKNFEALQDAMKESFMKIQGSGWVYLSTQGDIKTIANHAVRIDIALLIDAWEHAWSLDYQWNKEKYFDNIWRIINWEVINQRL